MRKLCLVALVYSACLPKLAVQDDTQVSCSEQADCPVGWRCDERAQLCRSPTAADPRCGDGALDEGEACDCGDSQDNKPVTCAGNNSNTAPNRCRVTCVLPSCGDGGVDDGEDCDDGNAAAADGCSPTCKRERCGNLALDPGEVCDDGNFTDGDGCSADCRSSEECGNGIRDFVTELCDCGSDASHKPALCSAPNGAPGSPCTSECTTLLCGDGAKNGDEVCDFGTALNGVIGPSGYCSRDCLSDGHCGNGYRDVDLGEQCDDHNFVQHDGCSSDCRQEVGVWQQVVVSATPSARVGAAAAYDPRRERMVVFGGETGVDAAKTFEYDGTRWFVANTKRSPSARSSHRMVFDSARGAIVLFGGVGADGIKLDDTWTYDGSDWTLLTTLAKPSPRDRHVMAYDSQRDRIVLFGGRTDAGLSSETWELHQASWSLVPPGPLPNPSARAWAAATFHDSIDRVVMFGGETLPAVMAGNFGENNETWHFDGSDWVLATPALPNGAIPVRARHVLEYIPTPVDRTVLYGGNFGGGARFGDTWFYNGTSWALGPTGNAAPSGPLGPSNGFGVALPASAVNTDEQTLLVFSGARDTINNSVYTFKLTGPTWSTLSFAAGVPPSVYRSAMVFDERRQRAVLFGGDLLSGLGNTTWEFDGANWLQSPASGPAARRLHKLTYMTKLGRVMTFGGGGASILSDTCLYDGEAWSCSNPVGPTGAPGPTGRANYALTYDVARGVAVLFGGNKGGNVYANDTWEFDGTHWVERTPAISPDAREAATLVYDPARGVLLVGGANASSPKLADVWSWNGTSWTQQSNAAFGARQDVLAGFMPGANRTLVFGGRSDFIVNGFNDTWELGSAGGFLPVRLLGFAPPGRVQSQSFVNTSNASFTFFGGFGDPDLDSVTTRLSDMWSFQYASAATDELCTDGADNDGDALADCGDPDCSRLNVCKASGCFDGTNEEVFAPGVFGCGGSVSHPARATLCASHARPCSVTEWAALNGAAPAGNYWLEEALRYDDAKGCAARLNAGSKSCPLTAFDDPMRVCGTTHDAFGNDCDWVDCGLGTHTPNEFLGGCVDKATAGTLCCTR